MPVSKWTFLAWSTAAIIVWALYKMYGFYKSGEGRDFMKAREQQPPAQVEGEQGEQGDRDTRA